MTTPIHGFCEPRFAPLLDAFRANFDDGLEVGASLAVTQHGRPVVDVWAGHADRARTRPWERDTIVLVFSTTKIALAMSFLTLVDRGLVDLDAAVASYWPEFAAGGKDSVTVREAMTHRGGVPGFDPPVRLADLHDWDATVANIAAQAHWYGGRPVLCYNLLTVGFILGEIMRRVDGRLPSQLFREEFADRADIDFQLKFGSEADLLRVADLVALSPPGALLSDINDPVADRAYRSMKAQVPRDWETWPCRRAEIPAANGYANARSIARMCSIGALGGTLDGRRYLSQGIIDEASSVEVDDVDPILGSIRLGLELGLHSDGFPAPTPTCFFWGGYGGSLGVMDQVTGVAFGYAMNNLVVPDKLLDDRQARFWGALGAVMRGL
jgi:CubicO group peptidase (beta-lactamase class C family)